VFGGFSAVGFGAAMPRVFASPGPIYEPEGTGPTTGAWRAPSTPRVSPRRADPQQLQLPLRAGGSMMETGAHALGCTVFPGGTGQTEQQVQAMAELQPAGYIGTPSFLKIIVEKAPRWAWPCPA
jgi:phenylacetate-CoA ligase